MVLSENISYLNWVQHVSSVIKHLFRYSPAASTGKEGMFYIYFLKSSHHIVQRLFIHSFNSINFNLFYFILFYFVLFCFVLFCFVLFYCIFICFVLFCFVLFYLFYLFYLFI